jgi:hypothetical protein
VTTPSDGDRIIYDLKTSTDMKILFHDDWVLNGDSPCIYVFLLSVCVLAFCGTKM